MKLPIELFPATVPPDHSRLVIGLDGEEGEAYPCYFDFDFGWRILTGTPENLAYWFEVPSVRALNSDMMLTAVAEYEAEREGLANEQCSSI